MQIHHIEKESSVLNHFLAELRDTTIQKDSMRFRTNLERIGQVLGYELSKTLSFNNKEIKTPLGIKKTKLIENQIVLCTILRAGLPLQQGLHSYFDAAEVSFISAYRKHHADGFSIEVEYLASTSLEGKTLILSDPMLATGQSLVACLTALKKMGIPKEIHVVSAIGASDGVTYVANNFPENSHLWIASIDSELNKKGYIIPGLGDAGDLAFGSKLQQ